MEVAVLTLVAMITFLFLMAVAMSTVRLVFDQLDFIAVWIVAESTHEVSTVAANKIPGGKHTYQSHCCGSR